MQIRRFFCPDLSSSEALLSEEESLHALRVLRLVPGDRMILLDGKGAVAEAELAETAGSRRSPRALCRVLARRTEPFPERGRLHLHVAPPKGRNFDLVLRSAAELGVFRIVPILTRRSVAQPRADAEGHRQTLTAACKQCGNPFLPEVSPPADLPAALERACPEGCFGAVPAGGDAPDGDVAGWDAETDFSVWIGPEGGFDPEEERMLRRAGLRPVAVGRLTLRVETAVPAILGYLDAHRGSPLGRTTV